MTYYDRENPFRSAWKRIVAGVIGAKARSETPAPKPTLVQNPVLDLSPSMAVPAPTPRPATKQAPTVKAPSKKATPAPKKNAGRPSLASGGGTKARMFELEKIYMDEGADPTHRAAAALELVSLRGKAKKSWNALGYPKLTDRILLDDVDRFGGCHG